jgi:hypothetical protein
MVMRPNRVTLDGYLRDVDIRLQRQERHVHNPSQGEKGKAGEKGEPGPAEVSSGRNNKARIGADHRIYVNEILASKDPPTAAEFYFETIPVGSIWVQLPPE